MRFLAREVLAVAGDPDAVLAALWDRVPAHDGPHDGPQDEPVTYRVERGAGAVSWAHGTAERTSFVARVEVRAYAAAARAVLVVVAARRRHGLPVDAAVVAALRSAVLTELDRWSVAGRAVSGP